MRIEIVSDMICPWCYLGKRRLEAALAERPELRPEIHWLPFELNPAMPEGGLPREEYLAPKIGGLQALRDGQARLAGLGAAEGLNYRFDLIEKSPNTRAAHALARMAAESGCQDAVLEGLFRAYFECGEDLGELETLVAIGAAAGLEAEAVRRRLVAREDWPEIEAMQREIRAAGISGVPFFIIDRSLALSGAQEPAAFHSAFDQLARTNGANP